MTQKYAIIIGAGPAGLTAAYEIIKSNSNVVPIILEESGEIGGISRTIQYKGNRMDIGGHRFFSKNDRIINWWTGFMPLMGELAWDDQILSRKKSLNASGPNPNIEAKVMLIRDRISRIFYLRKFFDYPISLKFSTFKNLGIINTISTGTSYGISCIFKRHENSLEDFMINRFGKVLYQTFFEDYTKKVWGRHPVDISADWGAQRIKGLSLKKAVLTAIKQPFAKKDYRAKNQETSLIEQFLYPKYGPGQLWEIVAQEIKNRGGEIYLNHKVERMVVQENHVNSVSVIDGGREKIFKGDYFFSSMPIKDLIGSMDEIHIPEKIREIADNLPYRDFITVGLLVKKLKIPNQTKYKSIGNIIPDTWIYIQDREVRVGRLQIFNNWSPYMVNDPKETVWLGLEYFCNEADELWNMENDEIIQMAKQELTKIEIIDEKDVLDACCTKVKKAYPAYFGSYKDIHEVRNFLDRLENLWCIGRNGQHRYNNMDHSMLTAILSVEAMGRNSIDKTSIWAVNSEEDYHE